MEASAAIPRWECISPTEANVYCLFPQSLEADPLILFHATPRRSLDAIARTGFQPVRGRLQSDQEGSGSRLKSLPQVHASLA